MPAVHRTASLLVLLLTPAAALAQTAAATGRITDPSGSVVPQVAVVIINVDTRARSEATSNELGYYTLPSLKPGSYQMAVQKQGFKPITRTGIRLLADDTVRIDFTLELGTVAESVNVVGEVQLLRTETSELATSITGREYHRLPLIQVGRMRSPANFLYLSPGVHGNLNLDGAENISATNQIQVHGSPKQHTEVLVDGLSGGQSRTTGSINEMAPPVDAILEFKVQASQMSAEFGHTGAAVVNFTIKSGTNDLHGSAFHLLRNDKLDARNWLAPSRAITRQNEFGMSVGGPIYLPNLYNGRDRSFFFFAYSGARKRGLDNIERVRIPTPEFIAGDFSRLVDARGNPVLIYDPSTTRPDGSGGFTRTPFENNRIPSSRIDPVAANVARLIPAPNAPAAGPLNYQDWIGESLLDPDVITWKIDHSLSSRQKLFATFNWNQIPRLRNRNPLPDPINDGFFQDISSSIFRLSHDYFFRSTLLNNLALGYNRFRNPNGSRSVSGGWPARLGLGGVPGAAFPVLVFTNGYATFGSSGLSDNIDQTYFVRDALTWTRGRHILKFGGEVRWNQLNDRSLSNNSGTYSFSNLGTAFPGTAATGDGFASFLLGEVHSASLNFPSTTGTRRPYWGFFFQDDLRLTSSLTLNLGLRFEFEQAPYEAADRHSIIDLTAPNPAASNRPGALVYAGNGAGRTGRRTLAYTDYSGWGPRFGFAWRAGSKTVVRGGYGLYYANNNLGLFTAGFNISASFASVDNGITPAFRLRDGFPQDFSREPAINPAFLNNQNGTYLERSGGAMPRTQNWSFGIQRELTPNLLFEVNYIANHNTGQTNPGLVNIDQLEPRYLSLGALLTNSVTSPPAVAAGIRPPYPGFAGSVAQSLRAFPQYRDLTAAQAKAGNSFYHAMELRARQRLSRGISFDASYTFSKNIGYNNPSFAGRGGFGSVLQDNYNRRLERAVLPYDIPHALLIHYIYDLPFRRPGAIGKLVSGWSISGIHSYQSGNPLPVFMTNSLPIFNNVLRPDIVQGQRRSTGISSANFQPNTDRAININAFSPPAPFQFGNAAPYYQDLRNFAVRSEDLSLTKITPITERFSAELSAHFVNLFNRHRFGEIEANFSNAAFGRARNASFPRFIQVGLRLRL